MRLNLGSSDAHLKGFVNVDLVQPCDQVADLALPWPWEDSSAEEILARDIFEHIGDCHSFTVSTNAMGYAEFKVRHWSGRIHVMNEAHRVLVPGGRLTMECPDAAKGAGQWQDPTHVTPWTPNGMQYFCVDMVPPSKAWVRFHEAHGTTAKFKLLSCSERMYEEMAGSCKCQVFKFTAILEAVK